MKVLRLLAEPVRSILDSTRVEHRDLREIRMRIGRGLMIETKDGERLLTGSGRIAEREQEAYVVSEEDIRVTLELLTGYSVYAYEEELRQGYFTVEGGHRVGVAGSAVSEGGRVLRFNHITFLNIRIAHECKGCSKELFSRLYGEGTYYHTLLFAPAGCGKTTFLRDLIRLISERGKRVGVADERSELGACYRGIPQHDLGLRSDVVDGCNKAEAMRMLLRSMTPEVLAADEIGLPEDVTAIRTAAVSGCKVVASAHGGSLEELKRNPMLRVLWEERGFERYVQLEKRNGTFGVKAIYDGEGKVLTEWNT